MRLVEAATPRSGTPAAPSTPVRVFTSTSRMIELTFFLSKKLPLVAVVPPPSPPLRDGGGPPPSPPLKARKSKKNGSERLPKKRHSGVFTSQVPGVSTAWVFVRPFGPVQVMFAPAASDWHEMSSFVATSKPVPGTK